MQSNAALQTRTSLRAPRDLERTNAQRSLCTLPGYFSLPGRGEEGGSAPGPDPHTDFQSRPFMLQQRGGTWKITCDGDPAERRTWRSNQHGLAFLPPHPQLLGSIPAQLGSDRVAAVTCLTVSEGLLPSEHLGEASPAPCRCGDLWSSQGFVLGSLIRLSSAGMSNLRPSAHL